MDEKEPKILFMSKKAYFYFLFIVMFIINVTGIINGIGQHENWRIIISIISLALILIAAIVRLIPSNKNRETAANPLD